MEIKNQGWQPEMLYPGASESALSGQRPPPPPLPTSIGTGLKQIYDPPAIAKSG